MKHTEFITYANNVRATRNEIQWIHNRVANNRNELRLCYTEFVISYTYFVTSKKQL